MHGLQAFSDCLEEKLAVAQWIYDEISKISDLQIMTSLEFTCFTFRISPSLITPEKYLKSGL